VSPHQTKAEKEAAVKQRLKGAIEKKHHAPPQRRSTRIKIPNAELTVRGIVYLDGPYYTAADDPAAGGTKSWAQLGPNALRSMNSDADASLPSAIVAARTHYGIGFKAGHLLNAELGGNGKDPANLTILTPSANSAHRAFDNPIKSALAELFKAYIAMVKMGIDVTELGYGIWVEVATTGEYWGTGFPDSCISTGLVCAVEVEDEPDLDAQMDPGVTDWSRNRDAAAAAMAQVQALVGLAKGVTDIPNVL
jgi:hypothetical protein